MLVSGIGGLGHIAVQYAVAMGRRVAAVDVDDTTLDLARRHGAEVVVNARTSADLIDPTYAVRPLSDVNAVLAEMEQGTIDGRVVLDMRA